LVGEDEICLLKSKAGVSARNQVGIDPDIGLIAPADRQ
jgi:hypothetical protein